MCKSAYKEITPNVKISGPWRLPLAACSGHEGHIGRLGFGEQKENNSHNLALLNHDPKLHMIATS
jgi:hypothetical protein